MLVTHITDGDSFNKSMKKKCATVMGTLEKKKLIGKAKPKAKAVEQATPSPKHESELDT